MNNPIFINIYQYSVNIGSPNHVCYVSGLPRVFCFCKKTTCFLLKTCVLLSETDFGGPYLMIFVNVPVYRTVLRTVRYGVPTYPYRTSKFNSIARQKQATKYSKSNTSSISENISLCLFIHIYSIWYGGWIRTDLTLLIAVVNVKFRVFVDFMVCGEYVC